jgi:hypothetical protein
MAMVDAGYTVIGDPPGLDYNNNWWYELGFGRDFAEGMVNVSAFLAAGRTIVTDLPDARDVVLVGSLKGSGGWRFQVAGQFGLSDGAPDHGITVSASRRF